MHPWCKMYLPIQGLLCDRNSLISIWQKSISNVSSHTYLMDLSAWKGKQGWINKASKVLETNDLIVQLADLQKMKNLPTIV